MKAYTDLPQSKKLAEILPFKSADMKWYNPANDESEFTEDVSLIKNNSEYHLFGKVTDWNDTPYVPCWSLAALLSIIPQPSLEEYEGRWRCESFIKEKNLRVFGKVVDTPIDACINVILSLKERNLI